MDSLPIFASQALPIWSERLKSWPVVLCWPACEFVKAFWFGVSKKAGKKRRPGKQTLQSRYCIPCPPCKQRHALWRDLKLGRKSGHKFWAFVVLNQLVSCSQQIYPRGNSPGSITIIMSQWKFGKWPSWLMTKASPKETYYYAPVGGVGSGNPGEIWHFQVFKCQFPHPLLGLHYKSVKFPPLGTKNCISHRQKTYSVELLKKLTQEYQKVKLLYKALLVIAWWDFGTGLRIHLYVMPGIVCIFSTFIQLMFVTDVQNWPEFHLIWHLEYTSKSINIENINLWQGGI